MAKVTGMIVDLDPTSDVFNGPVGLTGTSPVISVAGPRETRPARRGMVLGATCKRKDGADAFRGTLNAVLLKDDAVAKVVSATKFTYSAAGAEDTLRSLTDDCDAVIHAIAD